MDALCDVGCEIGRDTGSLCSDGLHGHHRLGIAAHGGPLLTSPFEELPINAKLRGPEQTMDALCDMSCEICSDAGSMCSGGTTGWGSEHSVGHYSEDNFMRPR